MNNHTNPLDEIRMPVRVYRRPDTGAVVTFLAVLHIGQEPYYADIRDRVRRLHALGARVYFEYVAAPTAAQLQLASQAERRGVAVLTALLDQFWSDAACLGAVCRREALVRQEGWEVHDVTLLEMAELYGPEWVDRQHLANRQAAAVYRDPARARAALLQALALTQQAATTPGVVDELFDADDRKVAAIREARVLCALDARLAEQPAARFVFVWEAAHLPYFEAALLERGFKLDDEEWISAIDVAALPPAGDPVPVGDEGTTVAAGRGVRGVASPSGSNDEAPTRAPRTC